MSLVISNAFSVNMLDNDDCFQFVRTSKTRAQEIVRRAIKAENVLSIVGHDVTAKLFSQELGIPIPCNRITYTVKPGDAILIGQYSGPRLIEGATSLPEGAKISWWMVEQILGGY